MNQSRRNFLRRGAALAGTVTILPYALQAQTKGGDVFETDGAPITIHPINHASFVMQTSAGAIYVDPVGTPAAYASLPAPDLVLVTHEHGDHYDPATLSALIPADSATPMLTNPAVHAMLPAALAKRTTVLANTEGTELNGVTIDAIAAYNTTPDRARFHPQGRDNGYVLTIDGFRTYISGDTEDIPEMRALTDIDLAFVCMNLPFTMDVAQAASAVADFKPAYVYPYHYRGRGDGTQDPSEFAALVGDQSKVKLAPWYG